MMRILFDIGHPGDFHALKNVAHLLEEAGAEVLFTFRQKEFEEELIRAEGFPSRNLGRHYKSIGGKIWGVVKFDYLLWACARSFNPGLLVSHGSIYAAHVAFLLGKRHLSLEDTGNMEQIRLYRPFTDVILTPEVLPKNLGPKQVRYNGYHEIAYLHPEYFTPNPEVFSWLNLKNGEQFAIVRFVSWDASHDLGHKGLSHQDKIRIVQKLASSMKVFISAEGHLPAELMPFRFSLPPELLHHALAHAAIVVSEGATVASEAGVLGTPAIYINPIPISYCQDLEKYGLVFCTIATQEILHLIDQIRAQNRADFQSRQQKMLSEKINVTQFFYNFIMQRYLPMKS
jgi:uncharacterized protein